jgi:predicted transcriptional regulator
MTEITATTNPGAASRELRRAFSAFRVSRGIYVAARLGIADLLKEGPLPIDELASATKSHARTLHRLLRLLAGEGIFAEVEDGTFALTPLADALRVDVPQSARSMVLLGGDPAQWRAWEALDHSVMTGQAAFPHVWGKSTFDYYAENPLGQVFSEAMTSEARRSSPEIARTYDFGPFKTLVDVGGGQGMQLIAILQSYPHLHSTLFDRPQVIESARRLLEGSDVAERCELVAGDFLDAVPAGADAYLVKQVLRDWPDEDAIRILATCREATHPDSKLLIVEPIIGFGNHDIPPERLDMNMQVLFGSMVRPLEDFRRILTAAGFTFVRTISTPGPLSMIEAVRDDHKA